MTEEKKGFLEWLQTEELTWIHFPHPSRADWFGIMGCCLLFGSIPTGITLMIIGRWFYMPLLIPIFLFGWILIDYAVYIE